MSKKYTLLTFKGICMNFLLELNFFILSHPLTSKEPRKIVQIHMHHPVSQTTKSDTTTSCRFRQNLAGSSDYRLCLPLRPHKAVRRGLHHSLAHATSLNSH